MASSPLTMTVGVAKWNIGLVNGASKHGVWNGLWADIGGKPPVRGEVDIAEQEQAPDNPGIRKQTFSTYGVSIPVSIGHRPITGNVIDASDIVPRLEGTYDYWVEYQIPLYDGGPE